jgi:hypothetical protein
MRRSFLIALVVLAFSAGGGVAAAVEAHTTSSGLCHKGTTVIFSTTCPSGYSTVSIPAGKRGPRGPRGNRGVPGTQGTGGTNGTNGSNGTNGATGPSFITGGTVNGTTLPGNSTSYVADGSNGTESAVQEVVDYTGTLTTLYVNVATAPSLFCGWTFQLDINGVASGSPVSASFLSDTYSGALNGTTGVPITAGDTIDVSATPVSGTILCSSTAPTSATWSVGP